MRLHTSYVLHVERRALNTLLAGQRRINIDACASSVLTMWPDFLADTSKLGGFHLKYLV